MKNSPLASLCIVVCLAFASAAHADPIKVFVLAGQSNMQGHAQVRTFEVIGLDPETAPMLEAMTDEDGSPIVCEDVWISSLGSAPEIRSGRLTAGYGAAGRGPKIGPEFTFGIYMHKLLGQPIVIIKTAWGGKSLHTDFRPPSAGPYEFTDRQLDTFEKQGKDLKQIRAEKANATGHYYRLMIDHIRDTLADIGQVYPDYDPQEGYQLAGFVWFQGWNDMVDGGTYPNRGQPGGYDAYSEVLTHFIRDVRKDLSAPDLPFVIGVMGAGGPIEAYPREKMRYADIHGEFRDAMAAPAGLPEFGNSVIAVRTEQFWDLELDELRRKDAQLKKTLRQRREAGELTDAEVKELLEKKRSEMFTPREGRILADGASNFEFHYLGSAKILGQIGKGFAEALYPIAAKK